jgi:hypothetical protein
LIPGGQIGVHAGIIPQKTPVVTVLWQIHNRLWEAVICNCDDIG